MVATLLASTAGSASSAPVARPPGLIVFSAPGGAGEHLELFTIRPDGSGRRQITHGASYALNPDLTHDRRRVVFWHTNDDPNSASWGRPLLRMTIGGLPKPLADVTGASVDGRYPKWSPDGRWVGFFVARAFGSIGQATTGPGDLWLIRPDGSAQHLLVDLDAYIFAGFSDDRIWDWSPDSRRIVFQAPNGIHGETSIKVVDVKTAAVTLVGFGQEPAWSPRGDLIAFAQRPRRIVVARPDGSERRRLTFVPQDEQVYSPVWSPDGRQLAFYATSDSRAWLYVIRADGSQRIKVAMPFPYPDDQARWSPDSHWLVFSDGTSLYHVRADGTSLIRLTSGTSPDWE